MRYPKCPHWAWCSVCGEPGYPCFGWEYPWACEFFSLLEEGGEKINRKLTNTQVFFKRTPFEGKGGRLN